MTSHHQEVGYGAHRQCTCTLFAVIPCFTVTLTKVSFSVKYVHVGNTFLLKILSFGMIVRLTVIVKNIGCRFKKKLINILDILVEDKLTNLYNNYCVVECCALEVPFNLHDGCSTHQVLISGYKKAMPNRELNLNLVPNGPRFYKELDKTIVTTWIIDS